MNLLDWGYYLFEVTGTKLEALFEVASIITKGPSKLFVSRKMRTRRKGLLARIKQKFGYSRNLKSQVKLRIKETKEDVKTKVARTSSSSSSPNKKVTNTTQRAPEQIQKLEAELSILRAEIARIMEETGKPSDQDQANALPAKPSVTLRDIAEDDTEDNPRIPLPPPPPPLLLVSKAAPRNVAHSDKQINEATQPLPTFRISGTMSSIDQPVDSSYSSGFSVDEIVKKGQNLRKSNLSRTPGGTPIRSADAHDTKMVLTTQDMIAQALKKKFSAVHQKSPISSPKSSALDVDDWEEEEDRYLVDNNNKRILKPTANRM